ncbi:unnamed protein product [Mesocestoides corti]|uniref:Hexosyltransferase n=1 Tax=Mesocestoides corti TaxID=53468 RepID=A0A0R3UMH9_MESCO|nr:unnamed protein product [Mesocestoides corti]
MKDVRRIIGKHLIQQNLRPPIQCYYNMSSVETAPAFNPCVTTHFLFADDSCLRARILTNYWDAIRQPSSDTLVQ